jgi:hypothetical protein
VSSRELAGAAAGFAVLTALLTYPQLARLHSHVGIHYDALFSIWRLAWVAHRLPRDPLHLFDANIFFPEPNTLALSDAMLLPALVAAPLMWLGTAPVVAYNLVVLASFVAAGLAAYFLARSLGASVLGAWAGGIVFAFQPYRFAHYAQLELLWSCWIPLAFWALHRAIDTYRVRYGLWLGLFVALQAYSCLYYAVFLVTALVIIALFLSVRSGRDLRQLFKVAVVALAVAVALIAPYVVPYRQSHASTEGRALEDLERWSPTAANYGLAQDGNWLYPNPPGNVDPFEKVLFPGAAAVLLASIGLIRGRRRLALAYGALLVVAFDLSLGLNGSGYRWLYEWLWPYRQLRVPGRFFVILASALSVLAALGLTTLRVSGRRVALAGLLLAFAVVESASSSFNLEPVPRAPRLYSWLARQPVAPVFEWPIPRVNALGLTQDPRYMYFSIRHWQPLVNGYSGHYPEAYMRFLERVHSFPASDAIAYLQRSGVRYVILHSHPDPQRYASAVTALRENARLRRQFSENTGVEALTLYLLEPETAAKTDH